jgi:hypothetical protein
MLADLRSCIHFDFPPNKNSSSALLVQELVSQFLQQKWQFRLIGEINNPAGTAKMLRHEMDLKVAELTRNVAANTHEPSFSLTRCSRRTRWLSSSSWSA